MSQLSEVDIAFSPRFFDEDQKVSLDVKHKPLRYVLKKILFDSGVDFKEIDQQIVLFKKPKKIQKYTLSGYIEDSSTGERLISATVYCPEQGLGTITNEYGFYSLTLPESIENVVVSYLGYQEQQQPVSLKGDRFVTFRLQPSLTLTEIIVTPDKSRNELLPSPANGSQLRPEEFQAAPDLGGESDIIRIAQLLPGVQTGADGFGGLHIRGGNADQNLVLLDGVPVYNPDHLLGIFSVFNTSAIKSAKLYRGSIPARFGGRASSVLDVRTKEGNNRNWSAGAALDLISGKAFVEGPFAKGKGSILLTGRATISDTLLIGMARRTFSGSDQQETSYDFFDFNAKVNYILSEKDRLYFSLYRGNDYFDGEFELEYQEAFGTDEIDIEEEYYVALEWGNIISSLRWNHVFSPKLFANTTLTYSRYQFSNNQLWTSSPADEEDEDIENEFFEYDRAFSNINDFALRIDFSYAPNVDHYMRFGGGYTVHRIEPQSFQYDKESFGDFGDFVDIDSLGLNDFESTVEGDTIHAHELEMYVEDEFKVGEKWQFNLGVRLSAFHTDDFSFNVEPRLIGHYSLTERSALKASLTRNVQYLHRNSFNEINLPEDVWIPSSKLLKPQEAWQATLGWESHLPEGVEIGLEGYLKKMDNLLVPFADTTSVEEEEEEEFFLVGNGLSYGLEFFVKKTKGKTGGWLSYTLSRSEREFENEEGTVQYAARFDRRHDFKIFLYHRLTKNLQVSANWLYGSPLPRLLNNNDDDEIFDAPYPYRNANRIPPYHRLDIGLSFIKKMKRWEHTFKLSAYNIYNRENPAFFRKTGQEEIPIPVNLIGIVPGIYYGLKF
ncbi:MAG: TonB-dependent receptor [Bacteroidota bacterium]